MWYRNDTKRGFPNEEHKDRLYLIINQIGPIIVIKEVVLIAVPIRLPLVLPLTLMISRSSRWRSDNSPWAKSTQIKGVLAANPIVVHCQQSIVEQVSAIDPIGIDSSVVVAAVAQTVCQFVV